MPDVRIGIVTISDRASRGEYEDRSGPAIRAYLAGTGSSETIIPHRQNRAVIFDANLFHGSDTVNFSPGYENHRINITLLFGRRAG